LETLNQNSMKVENTANIGDTMFHLTERMNHMMEGFRFDNEARPLPRAEDETRSTPRARNHLLLHVRQKGASYDGISHDLSLTGIKLVVKERLDTDCPIQVRLYLPYADVETYRDQTPLVLVGEIMHEDANGDQCVYGVRFQGITAREQKSLRYCFEFFNKTPEFAETTSL